ncbi:MAG TPA: hypothetical protein DCR40_19655 [Prolixibacteraceae bacterium]|nr:hypothetical protein [Prolixibacteraceae bacterium]
MTEQKKSFIYKNSLSIAFLLLAFLSLVRQAFTGLQEYNIFLAGHKLQPVTFFQYLNTGHFIQATFENWESEFFQMRLFVWFTVFLRQKGSSESKGVGIKEEVDREPINRKSAPWAVKKGGLVLSVYKHSLTISLLLLFLISFVLHWYGSNKDFNQIKMLEGKSAESMFVYLNNSRLWFESFQNWQSEFLSVFAIIFLSIFLREFGSPQSKPVDATNDETGK